MMHLRTLRLSEFRRFVPTFELAGLAPGLNLITGPNEAGKSTLAAAVRAAFLERYRTSTVTDFAPHGVAGAKPTVEVEFHLDGRDYRLRKTFLNRARCELQVEGGERLEGEAAEEALARLLGFALPGRGQSRPEHAGVPGLLWIRQGDSGDRTPVQHAGTHVREALAKLSGEIANEESDRILTRVEAERGLLLDLRGKPRGAYRETEEALSQARTEVVRLREARAALEATVDRLAILRRSHADDEREKPWLVFEEQAAHARAREQAASQEKAQLDSLLRERRQTDEQIALLLEQVRRDHQDDEELVELTAARTRAAEDAEVAHKRLRALIEFAVGEGWHVKRTPGGHLKFTKAGCAAIYTSSTASDHRAELNARAQIRRAEREARMAPAGGRGDCEGCGHG
ncbi:AAA family ATPase [Achromobacter sp. GG226]|nr:AAA family ATPase [Verticiella sp. GG226]